MSPGALFWQVQRPVVDAARRVTALVRRPPATTPPGGPLLTDHGRSVLAAAHRLRFPQPDGMSCGSSCLTVLRMLRDPAFAEVVIGADDPVAVFGTASLGVRRRTDSALDVRGRLQLPWSGEHLGVRPAAMTRLLTGDPRFGGGLRWRTVDVDPGDPAPAFDAVVAQVRAGEPVPFYVGDGHWMQHIVLVVSAADDGSSVTAYNPAGLGRFDTIARGEVTSDALTVSPWTRPWLVVLASPT